MSRGHVQLNTVNAVTVPYDVKSKQTHARLGKLTSLSRIERSSRITTIFELSQGFTNPVHIDKCSEAQFKFGGPPALHQSALQTNNQPMRTFYYSGS